MKFHSHQQASVPPSGSGAPLVQDSQWSRTLPNIWHWESAGRIGTQRAEARFVFGGVGAIAREPDFQEQRSRFAHDVALVRLMALAWYVASIIPLIGKICLGDIVATAFSQRTSMGKPFDKRRRF